jgi:nucleotide-binding universal stress UspA family protein
VTQVNGQGAGRRQNTLMATLKPIPMKILLAADGSEFTRKAARTLIEQAGAYRQVPEIRVHTVVPPIPYPGAARVVGKKAIDDYQREEAETALAVATDELARAGLKFTTSYSVGAIAEEIGACVKKHRIDLLVVGSHGHGALAGLALGSVATKLIATLDVPILVAR